MSKKIILILEIVLVLATLVGSVYSALTPANSLMNWFNVDDAFFYFKVAQNAVNGHGFTFDQINLSNGFHPLWMLVCLIVFWFTKPDLILPLRVIVVISGLLNAGTSLLLFRFLRKRIHPWAALAASLFWGLSPAIYGASTILGLETGLSIFCIVLLVSTASDFLVQSDQKPTSLQQFFILGLIGAFTILARLDNVFVVGVVGLFLLFKIKKIPASVIFDLMVVTISVFAAWVIRLGSEGVLQNTYTIYPMLISSVLIKPVALYFSGCYSTRKTISKWQKLFRVTLALSIAAVVEFVILKLLYQFEVIKLFSDSIFVLDVLLGFVCILVIHLLVDRTVFLTDRNPFSVLWSWLKKNFKSMLLKGIMYSIPIAIFVGSYMIFNKLTFGTFSPISGQVKHWWSTLPNTVYNRQVSLISVLGLNTGGSGPWSLLMSPIFGFAETITRTFTNANLELLFYFLVLLVFAVFLLIMRTKKYHPVNKFFDMMIPGLLVGCLIQITYYFASGYTHTRGWYWMAEALAQVLCGSIILDSLFNWLDGLKIKVKLAPLAALLIIGFAAFAQAQSLRYLTPMKVAEENRSAYLVEVHELEFYTPSGSNIGMTGGGLVAYFIEDRTIINLDGLINSREYFEAMKAGKAAQFLDEIPLNYAFGKPYMLLDSDPYGSFLKNRLFEVGYIRGNEGFTLFKYVKSP